MMIRTPVVVLHRYAYGDSSWIVKTLSPSLGILSFLVKGAKGKDSPFRTCFDPLACSEVIFNHNPSRDLHIPREASLLHWFPSLRNRLEDLAIAQLMAEILLRLASTGGHFSEEFILLRNALDSLEQGVADVGLLAHWLQDLCTTLGYALSLDSCVQCGAALVDQLADIWPAQGGGICSCCLGSRNPAYSKSFLSELTAFYTGQNILDVHTWARLEHFWLNYLKIHTGSMSVLNSWSWLQETRKLRS